MHVRDLMTREVCSCRPEDTLAQAARLMWEHDCGIVPVTDGLGVLCGVVTDRDACMAAWTRGQRLTDITVQSAMATKVVSCRPEDTLAAAEQALAGSRVRRLPVVDEAGRLLGILSSADLLRAAGSRNDATPLLRALATVSGAAAAPAVAEAKPKAASREVPATVALPRPEEAKAAAKAAEKSAAPMAPASGSAKAGKSGKAKGKGRK